MSNNSVLSLYDFFLATCVIFPLFITMTLIGSGMNSLRDDIFKTVCCWNADDTFPGLTHMHFFV